MSYRGEVLVAIMNNREDFAIAERQHWYRIPVSSVNKWLAKRWPPKWLAFYQTKIFAQEAYMIRYFAQVVDIRKVYRWQLFPNEPKGKKTKRKYYQLWLKPLAKLPEPILSRRFRRVLFIPTTWEKFINAIEINDLYDGSPLENILWAQLKRLNIAAEREELVSVKRKNYFLDFAIYCAKGKIDIETDGDTWHANPERAASDNLRDNDLESVGWHSLRFSTRQIQEEMEAYCVPKIVESINNLGGVEEAGKQMPRKINLKGASKGYQLSLFDDYSSES